MIPVGLRIPVTVLGPRKPFWLRTVVKDALDEAGVHEQTLMLRGTRVVLGIDKVPVDGEARSLNVDGCVRHGVRVLLLVRVEVWRDYVRQQSIASR